MCEDLTVRTPLAPVRVSADGGLASTEGDAPRSLADEVAVEVRVDGQPFAVLMASPNALDDLARGVCLSEGVVAQAGDIRSVSITHTSAGEVVHVRTRHGTAAAAPERGLPSRSSCGVCGVLTLADLDRPVPAVDAPWTFQSDIVFKALEAIRRAQPLHDATRAMHAAAWCDERGALVAAREDIGRHNALDKLIGAVGPQAGPGLCVITSRCSFEMAEKAARAGYGVIVGVSAPTTRAVEVARGAGMTLITNASDAGFTIHTHAERIAFA